MDKYIKNISIIMLSIGIILLTVYITRATTDRFKIDNRITELAMEGLRTRRQNGTVYEYRVSKAYEKMFSQPSIWMGYQDFDENDKPQKIYVK